MKNCLFFCLFFAKRSPIADPKVRGVIMGLSLDASVDTLAIQYLAVVQALAFGTRQILDSILNAGHKGITQLLMCGGLSHNSLFVQEHANITRCKVLLPTQETVLLGAAILGQKHTQESIKLVLNLQKKTKKSFMYSL